MSKLLASERPGFKFRFLQFIAEERGYVAATLSLSFIIGKRVIILVSTSGGCEKK